FFPSAPAPTVLYTLSLHDALPIWPWPLPAIASLRPPPVRLDQTDLEVDIRGSQLPALPQHAGGRIDPVGIGAFHAGAFQAFLVRSEEHTSELQSRENLVCRLLLEK